ncbi:MAG: hypothetical protein ACN4GK_13220 [Acidimicrobiia bacterium]
MRGIHRKRFRGHIAAIDRPDLELDVQLWVEERGITIARNDKPLGTWPMSLVEIDRVGSARFVVTLNGEHSAFVAQDPIAFSYEGLKAINAAKEKTSKREERKLRRRKEAIPSLKAILVARVQGLTEHQQPAQPPTPELTQPEPIEQPAPVTRPQPPPKVENTAPRPDPFEPIAADVVVELEVEEAALEEETVGEPSAFSRHPGVLERVRNARNGIVHEHAYTDNTVSGGILRRICNDCGHVSIGLNE